MKNSFGISLTSRGEITIACAAGTITVALSANEMRAFADALRNTADGMDVDVRASDVATAAAARATGRLQ